MNVLIVGLGARHGVQAFHTLSKCWTAELHSAQSEPSFLLFLSLAKLREPQEK